MKLSGIIWLEEIVEKIERKHHVTQEEVREVLGSSSHFRFVEKGHRREETFIRHWARLEQAATDRVLCAQENAPSVTDIGAGHDSRRKEKI